MRPRHVARAIVKLSVLTLFCATAFATPEETPVRRLTRDSQSSLELQTQLSKNFFKKEAYQAEYPVQVPYQEEEIYYVDVPYTEREAYTDYEEYWDREYRCHTHYEQECGYENVCRTVPDRQCRQERVCQPTPGRERCEVVTECGTNARGERICKDRKVCRREPGEQRCDYVERCENRSRQECSSERRCRNVPRERCDYESVRKTRPVTKYRDVTKYRKEERRRTVTKHRTEYRCCETRYRDVFDRQESIQVSVVFPEQAQLRAGEVERLHVELVGEPGRLDVSVTASETIYGYRVVQKQVTNREARIVLGLAPKYKSGDLGEKTLKISRLQIDPSSGESVLLIEDQGLKPRVATRYQVQVKDESGALVAKGNAQASAEVLQVSIALDQALRSDSDYTVALMVERSGIVLEKPEKFSKTATHKFDRIPAAQFGEHTFSLMGIKEHGDSLLLQVQDKGADPRFDTEYAYSLVGLTDGLVAAEGLVKSTEVLDAAGRADLALSLDRVRDDQNYKVIVKVERSGRVLSEAVQFSKDLTYQRILDSKLYINESLVGGLSVLGEQEKALLQFFDKAPEHTQVKSTYTVRIQRPSGFLGRKRSLLGQKTLSREQISFSKDGVVRIDFVKEIGVSKSDASKYVKGGKTLYLDLTVTRQSPRLNSGKPVVLTKTLKLKID